MSFLKVDEHSWGCSYSLALLRTVQKAQATGDIDAGVNQCLTKAAITEDLVTTEVGELIDDLSM